ncbi:MAG TPA: septal ring lytic transglycosylase RlpA family protein [Solirubrobacterales bacterium]|nr:septal ring lytic transglycosylase RlpA family protein [Solirubrobacterales bacterium]
MSETSHRRARKFHFTAALGLGRPALRLRTGLLAGALMVLAFASVPGAQAATGGAAAIATPAPAETAKTSTPAAAGSAELSFAPFRLAGASWYGGKSMWGRSTACGQVLQPTTLGVANKTLPCGTPVKFEWHGHSIVAPVIDRGPYVKGRAWDLTAAAAEALEFEGVGRIRYAVALG